MDASIFAKLPDELVEAVVAYLPPGDLINFGRTCKRSNEMLYEPLLWRRHCLQGWKYWEPHHEIKEREQLPPFETKWRILYNERKQADQRAMQLFETLLKTQQLRIERVEELAAMGYDVKDVMLQQRQNTPDDAEDVLARRYYADAVLGQVHRVTALEKWSRLQNRQMVRLEDVLCAFDLFVLGGNQGDLSEVDRKLDRLAEAVRSTDPDFEHFTTRRKAIEIARYLQNNDLVGNQLLGEYHALRNNFISLALFEHPHTSLPLVSVAIYCAVARRLGVNARPSNYPHHVHAVVQSPPGLTLDGASRPMDAPAENERNMDESITMHMDPWRSDVEVPRDDLVLRLTQMGAPMNALDTHLAATTNLEMAMRTSRNIMNSITEARDRARGNGRRLAHPDTDAAWYGMLWSMLVLGESNHAAVLQRRRQCLPYLVEQHNAHFPEDIGLIERIVIPMFEGEREHSMLVHHVTTARKADQNRKAPSLRTGPQVAFKIGTLFLHKRYGYQGMIIGWDNTCSADQRWIEQMRVEDLPRGRDQPFYNVIADDKSPRYVAEENIDPVENGEPNEILLSIAGRYFKRWDKQSNSFVSNIRDEYPED